MIRATAVAEPPGPLAVAVYVTEDAGLTERLPVVPTSPNPGSIRTAAVLRASHCRVVDAPRSMLVGCAVNVIVGAGGGGGGG